VSVSFSKMSYAYYDVTKESYNTKDTRSQAVGDYEYNQEDSTDRLAVYKNDHKKVILLGMRGTKGSKDWLSNLNILTGRQHNDPDYQYDEETFLKLKREHPDYQIVATGHSRGGDRARYLTHKYRDLKAVTYDAASGPTAIFEKIKCGIMEFFTSTSPCQRVVNLSASADPVSVLSKYGLSGDNTTLVDVDASGMVDAHGLDKLAKAHSENPNSFSTIVQNKLGVDF
jgi:putative lipase involved disintegration of autophagic bodies